MKTLVIDDKWSVDYDDKYNDSPTIWKRYGEVIDSNQGIDNLHVAMFYALLDFLPGGDPRTAEDFEKQMNAWVLTS